MNALATSFTASADNKVAREPSIKRKRLHILYLINDILHHGKFQSNDVSINSKIQPMLMGLVGSAASFKGCPKHQRKIQELLGIWEEKDYYGAKYVDKLRETANNAAESGDVSENAIASGSKEEASTSKSTKYAPYVMPATHGDTSTPWFDLPAANLMPHIIPNSTKPINPDMIKPLQFVAGPADEALVVAVKALLDDVEVIFGESSQDEKESWDIDELGQPVILDEITGDVIGGEGYYGWSRTFCEKMKRRKKGLDMPDRDDERGRDSRSRSSSRSVRKRRHSDSGDESSRERYRSRQRRRSYSSSRSPSPDRPRSRHSGRNSRSRYSSPKRSPSASRPAGSHHKETNQAPNTYQSPTAYQGLPYPPPSLPAQMPFQPGFNPAFPPPPPPSVPYNNNQNFNAPGFNASNQQFGSWPPPPPPPNMNFSASQPWPPPPPPGNPPINFQPHQNPYQQFPGAYPPTGPGNWQQQGDGRGYNNSNPEWNSGPPNRGRGNFRGRGRGW